MPISLRGEIAAQSNGLGRLLDMLKCGLSRTPIKHHDCDAEFSAPAREIPQGSYVLVTPLTHPSQVLNGFRQP
jgi:hypothetical protein